MRRLTNPGDGVDVPPATIAGPAHPSGRFVGSDHVARPTPTAPLATSASPPPRHERTRQAAIRLGMAALAVPLLSGIGAQRATAAGILPGANPQANRAPSPDFLASGACGGVPGAWHCANPCVTTWLTFPTFTVAPRCDRERREREPRGHARVRAVPCPWHPPAGARREEIGGGSAVRLRVGAREDACGGRPLGPDAREQRDGEGGHAEADRGLPGPLVTGRGGRTRRERCRRRGTRHVIGPDEPARRVGRPCDGRRGHVNAVARVRQAPHHALEVGSPTSTRPLRCRNIRTTRDNSSVVVSPRSARVDGPRSQPTGRPPARRPRSGSRRV